MNNQKNSPFVFYVGSIMRSGVTEVLTQTGPSPTRIGPQMIAIPQGNEVSVTATITPLGDAVMVDATVTAQLHGECVRCLTALAPIADLHVTKVFAATPDFITTSDDGSGDDGDDDGEVAMIEGDTIDLLQAVVDEAGLYLPFNPVCEDGCTDEVPEPDGISGEHTDSDAGIDPRWAGLEKFL